MLDEIREMKPPEGWKPGTPLPSNAQVKKVYVSFTEDKLLNKRAWNNPFQSRSFRKWMKEQER